MKPPVRLEEIARQVREADRPSVRREALPSLCSLWVVFRRSKLLRPQPAVALNHGISIPLTRKPADRPDGACGGRNFTPMGRVDRRRIWAEIAPEAQQSAWAVLFSRTKAIRNRQMFSYDAILLESLSCWFYFQKITESSAFINRGLPSNGKHSVTTIVLTGAECSATAQTRGKPGTPP